MLVCDYTHCSNLATHYDSTHNVVCDECMTRCIEEEGEDAEGFETI